MKRVSVLTKAVTGCWVLFGSALTAAAILDSQRARVGACLMAAGCVMWLTAAARRRLQAKNVEFQQYVARVGVHMETLATTLNNERSQHAAALREVVAQRDDLANRLGQTQLPASRQAAAQDWIRSADGLSALDLAGVAVNLDQLSGMTVVAPDVPDVRHQTFIAELTRAHSLGVAQLFTRLMASMAEIRTSGVDAGRLERLSAIFDRLIELEAITTPAHQALFREVRALQRSCVEALARVAARMPIRVPMRA